MVYLISAWKEVCEKLARPTLEYSGAISIRLRKVAEVKKILNSTMKVQDEYLIYAEIVMIGLIGGTFGMFNIVVYFMYVPIFAKIIL